MAAVPAPDRGRSGGRRRPGRAGTSTRRGASRPSPPGCSPCPFMVLFLVVHGRARCWPSLGMSFTDMRQPRHPQPVRGRVRRARQLHQAAVEDPVPQGRLQHRCYFVVLGVPLTMALALAVAVALNRASTGSRTSSGSATTCPVVTSIVAVSVVWKFLLQPDSGLLNTVLGWVGIDGPGLARQHHLALPSLIVMAAWRNFGTLMVIFLAGLQTIPKELHEAAEVDGAGGLGAVPLHHPAHAAADAAVRRGDHRHRLPPVLRGAVRDDQGRPARLAPCRSPTSPTTSSASATTATPPPPATCCSSPSWC